MSETPMKLVVDCSTNEEQYIPLTTEEIAQAEADALAYAEQQAQLEAERQAQEAAKASAEAKLAAIGLTAEEIAALKA